MANKPKVTERLFNSVKKLAKTGASKSYIMKVSGLSNMTVYRILKAKSYEEYRHMTKEVSERDYRERKANTRMHLSESQKLRLAMNELASKSFHIESKLIEICSRVAALEDAHAQAKTKKHWWSK